MESTQPPLISTSELAPVNGNSATPFSQQTVVLTKQAYIALKWEANYWRVQHARLVEREAALKAQVEALEATVRDLNQRLYGTKSEQSSGADGTSRPSRPLQEIGGNNLAVRATAAVIAPPYQWWPKCMT